MTILRTAERELDVSPVDLEEVAGKAWRTIETKEASLTVNTTGTISADEDCLQELLTNLFRNAIDHGGSDVTIHVGLLDDRDGFYVEDTGEGIPPEERSDIFEYGYSSKWGHAGLGLNIVSWLADAHDWTLDVTDGEVADGARFEIGDVEYLDHRLGCLVAESPRLEPWEEVKTGERRFRDRVHKIYSNSRTRCRWCGNTLDPPPTLVDCLCAAPFRRGR